MAPRAQISPEHRVLRGRVFVPAGNRFWRSWALERRRPAGRSWAERTAPRSRAWRTRRLAGRKRQGRPLRRAPAPHWRQGWGRDTEAGRRKGWKARIRPARAAEPPLDGRPGARRGFRQRRPQPGRHSGNRRPRQPRASRTQPTRARAKSQRSFWQRRIWGWSRLPRRRQRPGNWAPWPLQSRRDPRQATKRPLEMRTALWTPRHTRLPEPLD